MRELKFRAWNKSIKEMYDEFQMRSRYLNLTFGGSVIYELHSVELEWDVMQCTGLKDKNGVEIYEGDICKVLYTDWPSQTDNSISFDEYIDSISKIGTVEFFDSEWAFKIDEPFYGNDFYYGPIKVGAHGKIKVIGNIYQNPELLAQ